VKSSISSLLIPSDQCVDDLVSTVTTVCRALPVTESLSTRSTGTSDLLHPVLLSLGNRPNSHLGNGKPLCKGGVVFRGFSRPGEKVFFLFGMLRGQS